MTCEFLGWCVWDKTSTAVGWMRYQGRKMKQRSELKIHHGGASLNDVGVPLQIIFTGTSIKSCNVIMKKKSDLQTLYLE